MLIFGVERIPNKDTKKTITITITITIFVGRGFADGALGFLNEKVVRKRNCDGLPQPTLYEAHAIRFAISKLRSAAPSLAWS